MTISTQNTQYDRKWINAFVKKGASSMTFFKTQFDLLHTQRWAIIFLMIVIAAEQLTPTEACSRGEIAPGICMMPNGRKRRMHENEAYSADCEPTTANADLSSKNMMFPSLNIVIGAIGLLGIFSTLFWLLYTRSGTSNSTEHQGAAKPLVVMHTEGEAEQVTFMNGTAMQEPYLSFKQSNR